MEQENIIELQTQKDLKLPTDLKTLQELAKKYNFKYDYLYKVVQIEKQIPHYFRGRIFVSEEEFVSWVNEGFVKKVEEC